MKIIFACSMLFSLLFAATVRADIQTIERQTIYSRGQAQGFCDGSPSSYFCFDQLKRRAQDDSARDADFQCRMRQGRIEIYSGYCNPNCNPYSLPPNSPSQFVSCYANCTSTCLIESQP